MAKAAPDVLKRMTPEQANAQAQRAGQKVVFHLLCLLYFGRIIQWHFTPPAQLLPGSIGFGWFFKYFTFCSFTLQTIQFALCVIDDATWQAEKPPVRRLVDVFSCSMFGMANTVTFMFYTMNYITGGKAEEPCIHRPNWLSPSVHIYNAAAAWADILISDSRSFSSTSLVTSMVIAVLYASWLLTCATQNKKFPYPFLNVVKQPHGFIATFLSSCTSMIIWFYVGRLVRPVLVSALDKGTAWLDGKLNSSAGSEATSEKKTQ